MQINFGLSQPFSLDIMRDVSEILTDVSTESVEQKNTFKTENDESENEDKNDGSGTRT